MDEKGHYPIYTPLSMIIITGTMTLLLMLTYAPPSLILTDMLLHEMLLGCKVTLTSGT